MKYKDILRIEWFYERVRQCEICKTENLLTSLIFDKDNIMTLYRNYHIKIHKKDKIKLNLK